MTFQINSPKLTATGVVKDLTATYRTRFEPNPVSGDPEVSLMAEVADPLWMLGRQWQFSEFAGEDTGTPLAVQVTTSFRPFTSWHPGPIPAGGAASDAWEPLPEGALLESLVEAEGDVPGTHPGEESARLRAAAAWALESELTAAGEAAAVRALRAECAVPAPVAGAVAGVTDPQRDWHGVQSALAGHAIDPAAVADAFATGEPAWFTAALRPGVARQRAARAAVDDWLHWWRTEVAPPTTRSSWVDGALEYGFAVATADAVFTAPAYLGGTIGWSSFDLAPDAAVPATPDGAPAPAAEVTHHLATRLTFPGMPASRFWEFEDADVDLGAVWADPYELARVLVVEAAIVTGDDWLVIAVDSPPGGVLEVTEVRWRDTFGEEWVADEQRTPVHPGRRSAPWRLFTTTEAGRRDEGGGDARREARGLLVPPAAAATIDGSFVEDVRFTRDETTNLVWAIVETVRADSGDPVPVVGQGPPPVTPIDSGTNPPEDVLGYELQTYVPDTWHPYVAVIDPGGVQLQRARLDSGRPAQRPVAQSLLLGEPAQQRIRSAEVPREGVRVQRVPRLARRADGSWALWMGRRVRPGFGESESGLLYDTTRKPSAGG